MAEAIELWLLHVRAALTNTADQSRIFVFYEDMIDDWKGELQCLADFIGLTAMAHSAEVQTTVEAFVDRDLQHHRTPTSDATAAEKLGITRGALAILNDLYAALRDVDRSNDDAVDRLLQEALEVIQPEARAQRAATDPRWTSQFHLVMQDIFEMIPAEKTLILVDGNAIGGEVAVRCRTIPFLERDGQYWGPPPDDATAIREFERLRQSGADFVVIGWTAFWWLDFYLDFYRYLRSQYRCVLENERLVIFDITEARRLADARTGATRADKL